jgi:hypothetical protein
LNLEANHELAKEKVITELFTNNRPEFHDLLNYHFLAAGHGHFLNDAPSSIYQKIRRVFELNTGSIYNDGKK